jgi:hypothetical protein
MIQFNGFKPDAMQKIAGKLGYQGDMNGFNDYLSANPDKKDAMNMYTNKAIQMARGGMVKRYAVGGTVPASSTPSASAAPAVLTQAAVPQLTIPTAADANIKQQAVQRMLAPGLAQGQTVIPVGSQVTAQQLIDPTSGQVGGMQGAQTALSGTSTINVPDAKQATTMGAATSAGSVDSALQATQAAQGSIDPRDTVTAAQATKNSVEDLSAAQGNATLLENPTTRAIQNGELIDGVANAQKAAAFTEQIQAAQATPTDKATVAGQLEGLMTQFEGGATPAWAAGAMRNATATLAARGLGASSMAGQAIIQAAMESAMPIAQADAQTLATFEAQNLSNRQQSAMLAAQQRATFMGQEFDQAFQARVQNASKISDVANMNFTADQQIALENSRAANTMNLANLSNSQALVIANASALTGMDLTNLGNRQQAAVQNAQSFLQMDMTNLSNQQQTDLFKAQQRVQSLFTDQAATNASAQFNATSQNQTDQFFSSLKTQASQFNAGQQNAQSQFNAGQANAQEQFNANLVNQRDQFNAQNRLVIDQNNAVWRREIATADTAAVNRSNELNASALLDISNTAYNNLWQMQADTMEWAWTSSENEAERQNNIATAKIGADAELAKQAYATDAGSSAAIGSGIVSLLTASSTSIFGGLF